MSGPLYVIPCTDKWKKFFQLYGQLPELWKIEYRHKKNKEGKREAAYEKLLQLYKTIDPNATIDVMKRKINGVRTCFNRELRKVEESERTSSKTGHVRVPNLWYFDALSFLREAHLPERRHREPAIRVKSEEEIWISESENGNEVDDAEDKNASSDWSNPTPVEQPFEQREQDTGMLLQNFELLQQAANQLNNSSSRDEATIYAEGWATSYRKLNERQKLLAKKAIEEIFVLGQLDQLQVNSVLINPR
ncbi:uncharacterized protein LOC115632647 [Scaptodrosophila lebanonensis]|uniref:Uncharacterized protein LOC115632647 n=1 Tax=Drosophila lebanonensis TaxID=7225 RepID=A0A6J2UF46_DROLE|nr:uncharacterized protein LOC115632647 [Scaptodrosophila lebanonensis]